MVRDQTGSGMLSALIGVAIAGIVAAGLAQFLGHSFQANGKLEADGERESIRRVLLTNLDCAETLGPVTVVGRRRTFPNCSSTNLRLFNNLKNPITANDYSIGRWQLQSVCTALGLEVRLVKPDKSGGYAKDPLTGKALDANHPRAVLFGDGTELCQDYFVGTSAKKVISGMVNVYWLNGQTNSNQVRVTFPFSCRNPVAVTQTSADSIACSDPANASVLGRCYNMPGTTSEDLLSRAYNVTSSGMDVALSTHSGVCVNVPGSNPLGSPCGSSSLPYPVTYIVTCDP